MSSQKSDFPVDSFAAPLYRMRKLELDRTWYQPTWVVEHVQLAVLAAAGDAPEPLELVPAQRVQSLVSRRVLHEPV